MGVDAGCAEVSGVKLAGWPVAGAEGVKLNPVPAAVFAVATEAVEGCVEPLVGRSERVATARVSVGAVAAG